MEVVIFTVSYEVLHTCSSKEAADAWLEENKPDNWAYIMYRYHSCMPFLTYRSSPWIINGPF